MGYPVFGRARSQKQLSRTLKVSFFFPTKFHFGRFRGVVTLQVVMDEDGVLL